MNYPSGRIVSYSWYKSNEYVCVCTIKNYQAVAYGGKKVQGGFCPDAVPFGVVLGHY